MGERLGVLGGAFDPPHVGHALVALDVLEALELDRLLMVPAARPPHRETRLPAAVRLELTRRLFAEVPGVEVSDLEHRRRGPSYTVDTLEETRASEAPSKLFCIIGVDQWRSFASWHRHRRIAEVAELVVVSRDGQAPSPGGEVPYRHLEVTRVDVSGTDVRRRLREGRSIRWRVPEPIRELVERAWSEHVATGEGGRGPASAPAAGGGRVDGGASGRNESGGGVY